VTQECVTLFRMEAKKAKPYEMSIPSLTAVEFIEMYDDPSKRTEEYYECERELRRDDFNIEILSCELLLPSPIEP
jgi:hypothetical protein